MPFSDSQGKAEIATWVTKIQPANVLDIGPGAGVYSDLVRQNAQPNTVDAIEVWAPYVQQFRLHEKYDTILISDIMVIHPNFIHGYDLVIMGDVIEHLTRCEARAILAELVENNANVVVSFPVLHLDQGDYEGNWFESHRDHWSYQDMLDFAETHGYDVVDSGHGDVIAWFWLQA